MNIPHVNPFQKAYAGLVGQARETVFPEDAIKNISTELGNENLDVYVFVRAFALIELSKNWREEIKRAKVDEKKEFREVPIFTPPEGASFSSHLEALFTYCMLIEELKKPKIEEVKS